MHLKCYQHKILNLLLYFGTELFIVKEDGM